MALKLFIGLGLGAMAFIVREPFTAAFLVFSTMTVFLAITVLLEFSNLILRPDEHLIIAALPVGSKTFFAAKMIHLLAYVNVLGSLLPAAGDRFRRRQPEPLLLPGSSSRVLAATAMGLSFVLLYALLLRIVDREAMQRVLIREPGADARCVPRLFRRADDARRVPAVGHSGSVPADLPGTAGVVRGCRQAPGG